MLAHLSATSPYVCDLNRGPIEPANRMATMASTKKVSIFLESKESLPKQTRTPLKLLSPDEVPLDTTSAPNDIDASLQPVWYTEQTIVDEQVKTSSDEREDIASIIREQQRNTSIKPTPLPTIESDYSSVLEDNELPPQTSLMHKSSTFTIEPEPSLPIDCQLNDSEKENVVNGPSDDSFRALEHLLGLGSGTTTVRDSPKTNHDTLSLTVVTPTDIINATTTSMRASFLPKSGEGSAPNSQTLPSMPTIESMDSTMPPSFLAENTIMEDEAPVTLPEQSQPEVIENDSIKDDSNTDDDTNFSFELNDFPNSSKDDVATPEPEPQPAPVVPSPMLKIRAPTCADVAYRALIKPRIAGRVSQPVKAESPLAKSGKARSSAPSSRLLRSSCRRVSTENSAANVFNQEEPANNADCLINESNHHLVQVETLPEEDEDSEVEPSTSVTLNLTTTEMAPETMDVPTTPDTIDANTEPATEATPTKPFMPLLSREYTYTSPKPRSSQRRRTALDQSSQSMVADQTTMSTLEECPSPSVPSKSMLNILMTKATATSTPSAPVRQVSSARASRQSARVSARSPVINRTTKVNVEACPSPSIASQSMLGVLLTNADQPATPKARQSARVSSQTTVVDQTTMTNLDECASPAIASKSMLGILLTNADQPTTPKVRQSARVSSQSTVADQSTMANLEECVSPSIASKSMLGILLTAADQPATPKTRQSARVSSQAAAQMATINPLHSSTPSSKRHSLQIVSIGEEEQVSITVAHPSIINEEDDVAAAAAAAPTPIEEEQHEEKPENEEEPPVQIETAPLDETAPVPMIRTMEIGIQTTPSLDSLSRRHINVIEQQTTPPIQTTAIIQLQRNVRFQLTPTTDARLAEKEKLEEQLRGMKPDVVFAPVQNPLDVVEPKKTTPKKTITKAKAKKTKAAPAKKASPKKRATRTRSASPKTAPIKPESTTKDRKKKAVPPPPPVEAPIVEPTTKRAARKRSNTKPTEEAVVPVVEPIVKRAKIVKTEASARSSLHGPKTRARSTVKSNETPAIVPKAKSRSASAEPKPTTTIEEKKTQLPVENEDEIETLTVAALKTRLTAHQATIPKGAKKADLISLLRHMENKTQPAKTSQKRKQTETSNNNTNNNDTSIIAKRTRRQKK